MEIYMYKWRDTLFVELFWEDYIYLKSKTDIFLYAGDEDYLQINDKVRLIYHRGFKDELESIFAQYGYMVKHLPDINDF